MIALVLGLAVGLFLLVLRRPPDALEELGVSPTYVANSVPKDKIEAYLQLKEKLRDEFAKDSETDEWMSELPPQTKDMLKYKLMQRAIGDMAALQKIDADARGYWRLFSKNIVTLKFWNSVVEAERDLSTELECVKGEAASIEPTQNPQGIINEAMQFVVRFGDKLPAMDGGADAFAEAMTKVAMMPQPGHPGHPMGMRPPGPGPMPQLPPRPMGPPPPQTGGSNDAYSWRQDTDEVEISVAVKDTVTKGQIKVAIQSRSLRVECCGEVLVEGTLAAPCCPEGSTWTLSKGRVVVSLEKASPQPWPSVLVPKS